MATFLFWQQQYWAETNNYSTTKKILFNTYLDLLEFIFSPVAFFRIAED